VTRTRLADAYLGLLVAAAACLLAPWWLALGAIGGAALLVRRAA
jgi:hypothetical protein